MTKLLRNLWNDESGATMVEYALMVALIAVVCIAVVTLLGGEVATKFGLTNQQVADAGCTQPSTWDASVNGAWVAPAGC